MKTKAFRTTRGTITLTLDADQLVDATIPPAEERLEIWQGKETNVKAAQQALLHRARCNQAARRGEYDASMESWPS